MTRRFLPLLAAGALVPLTGCFDQPLTWAEVQEALRQSQHTARIDAFTGQVVEISTDFTLGQAAQDAAEELRSFLESQVPCSTVTRDGLSVSMDFGTLDDQCVYNGRTYAGVTTITLVEVGEGSAVVQHDWDGMTDGEVVMDGGATVTWDADAGTRTVVHEIDWTIDGEQYTGSGDRTQALLDPSAGLKGGIRIEGSREWEGPAGLWTLDIAGVEARPQDPVPQAGVYTLLTPNDKTATLTFRRIDDDTIEVVLAGGRQDHVWHVTALGAEYQD
ncbi:MAG: hypothetical protein H6742_14415 [Alphaproteobacteria bacterium]|nr:hypothetical protein [Alphaproteobacteria bacterium]